MLGAGMEWGVRGTEVGLTRSSKNSRSCALYTNSQFIIYFD